MVEKRTAENKRKVELKTRPNNSSVEAFIAGVEDEKKRADSHELIKMMRRVTGEEPVMWGTAIIGFGTYRYTYANGRPAEMCATGFSPRKSALTLYIMPGFSAYDGLLSRLGRYKTGKSCLYIKRLSDVDPDILEELVDRAYRYMKDRYPD
ncbi:DUF1801 domain-containing protein [Hoeflea sp. TYP-13]|uniref:DUF1801 domain-containing protein n=1 Tax=Hoeflea sp. TYP-13 TaxID=3230023 RepID=UPI0034C65348